MLNVKTTYNIVIIISENTNSQQVPSCTSMNHSNVQDHSELYYTASKFNCVLKLPLQVIRLCNYVK